MSLWLAAAAATAAAAILAPDTLLCFHVIGFCLTKEQCVEGFGRFLASILDSRFVLRLPEWADFMATCLRSTGTGVMGFWGWGFL